MMLSLLLDCVLALATVVAAGSMLATWVRHAAAWGLVDGEIGTPIPAQVRYISVRVVRAERSGPPVRRLELRLPECRTLESGPAELSLAELSLAELSLAEFRAPRPVRIPHALRAAA